MDFRYTEEQTALQDTLQRFIARDYGFAKRREIARSAPGYSAEAWAQYAELGLLALPFPEEFGGLNGGGVDTLIVMEQFGQGLLLEPYLSTVVLCGGLIRDAASAPMKQALLPQIAAGKLKLALAAYEAAGRYDLAHVACRAAKQPDGWLLTGSKSVVVDAPSADQFLVSARSSGAVTAAEGISLFLVPRDAAGVSMFEYPTQSDGRAADIKLVNVRVGPEAPVGAPDRALGAIERAVDGAIAALCAESLGIVSALNQATLSYLKTRKQFGVAIGNFQALQHRMAEMFIAAEQTRSMAIIAAIHGASDDVAERRRAVSGAKAYIGQSARFIGQQAVQLHGGMGVVDDLIVSHYFKRLTMIDLSLGNADFHLARIRRSASPPMAAQEQVLNERTRRPCGCRVPSLKKTDNTGSSIRGIRMVKFNRRRLIFGLFILVLITITELRDRLLVQTARMAGVHGMDHVLHRAAQSEESAAHPARGADRHRVHPAGPARDRLARAVAGPGVGAAALHPGCRVRDRGIRRNGAVGAQQLHVPVLHRGGACARDPRSEPLSLGGHGGRLGRAADRQHDPVRQFHGPGARAVAGSRARLTTARERCGDQRWDDSETHSLHPAVRNVHPTPDARPR